MVVTKVEPKSVRERERERERRMGGGKSEKEKRLSGGGESGSEIVGEGRHSSLFEGGVRFYFSDLSNL